MFKTTMPEGRPKYTHIIGKTPSLVIRRMIMDEDSEYEVIRIDKNYRKIFVDETNELVEGRIT